MPLLLHLIHFMYFISLAYVGIAYRQTRLEIHIDEQNVRVNIRGNNDCTVLIDNIEQDPMRTTCK